MTSGPVDAPPKPEAHGDLTMDPYATAAWGFAIGSLVVPILIPAIVALVLARKARRRIAAIGSPWTGKDRAVRAQRLGNIGVFVGTIVLVALFCSLYRTGLDSVRKTFFNWDVIKDSFPEVLRAFWFNVKLFMAAEFFVLIWALIVAVLRGLPGPLSAPVRWLMIAYVDIFRGLPALVTIYLVGFGLSIARLPGLENLSLFWRGVIALTLVYGAYVAEVYRSGIDGVHWSQTAAARSLGLSYGQTLRFVVIPQGVRRIIPPLLNDFIGLQKDTALVSTIGLFEGFRQASVYAGNHFNPSSVTAVGICFVAITIPLARFTDYLIDRDQKRMRAGG